MSDVINALKRLERAGSEGSRTTEKLVAAAETLRQVIEKMVPEAESIPRGYKHLNYNFDASWCPHDRNSALALAEAVSTGWIDELAQWLEARGAKSAEAATTLERAAEAVAIQNERKGEIE